MGIDLAKLHLHDIDITNEIRLFVEYLRLCRVFFVGHSTKILSTVLLSVMTTFTESRTLGKDLFAECQMLGKQRRSIKGHQSATIYSLRPLTLSSVVRWHSANYALL
jgi:hypothetical protein